MRISVKQLKEMIREAVEKHMMEEEDSLEGMTLSDFEALSDEDPRMQRLLRSPAAREYLRQNPGADIINPGPEKADFAKFARDFDRGEEEEDRERFARVPAAAKRPGGLFGPLRKDGGPSVSFSDDPLTADRKRREMNEAYIRRIVRSEMKKFR